jgi:cytoplasmic iron level regulating protein YaaA (DUF328/UPF0246 family)
LALVLILLPPSEGKSDSPEGPPLDVEQLSMPELTKARLRVLTALVALCKGRDTRARKVLGLSIRQDDELERNRNLLSAPTAPAVDIYTGVVYEFLDYRSLRAAARRRLDQWVVVNSALWGGIRLNDYIPAYRLSGDVALPRIGPLATLWRKPLATAMRDAVGNSGAILDLRSGTYAKMWSPDPSIADRLALGRVMQRQPDGTAKVVSHHNKATKGRLVRALAEQRQTPDSIDALVDVIDSLGFHVKLHRGTSGKPARLDIVVDEL